MVYSVDNDCTTEIDGQRNGPNVDLSARKFNRKGINLFLTQGLKRIVSQDRRTLFDKNEYILYSSSSRKNLAGELFNALKKADFFFCVIYWFLSPVSLVGKPLIIFYGRLRNDHPPTHPLPSIVLYGCLKGLFHEIDLKNAEKNYRTRHE